MSGIRRVMNALVGEAAYDKLAKAADLAGNDYLSAYAASRALVQWYTKALTSLAKGEAQYLDMPGVPDHKVYVENGDKGYRAQLIDAKGDVYYDFRNQDPQGKSWADKMTAVPHAILVQNGVQVEDSGEEPVFKKGELEKFGQAVDSLMKSGKQIPGDEQKVEDDKTPDEIDEQKRKAKKDDKKIVRPGLPAQLPVDAVMGIPDKEIAKQLDKEEIGAKVAQGLGVKGPAQAVAKLQQMRATAPAGVAGTPGGHLKSAMHKLKRMHETRQAQANLQAAQAPQAMPAKLPPALKKPAMIKEEMVAKAGEMPQGAGMPRQPAMPKPPKAPVPASNSPKASADKQAQASAQGKQKAPGVPKSPKMPLPGGPKMPSMSKSEKSYVVTEEEIYRPCHMCNTPEFVKSESGPKFKPCACFVSETVDMDAGVKKKFVDLYKAEDGQMRVKFAPDADPEAKKLFLLLLKTRVLVGRKFNQ